MEVVDASSLALFLHSPVPPSLPLSPSLPPLFLPNCTSLAKKRGGKERRKKLPPLPPLAISATALFFGFYTSSGERMSRRGGRRKGRRECRIRRRQKWMDCSKEGREGEEEEVKVCLTTGITHKRVFLFLFQRKSGGEEKTHAVACTGY